MKNPIISNAKALGIKPLTREQNEAIYERIRQGDKSAVNEMIEGNIALVIITVAHYIEKNPTFRYMQEDLQSACYVALTNAVNRFSEASADNPMGYIYEALRIEMVNTIWSAETVVVPIGKRGSDNPRKLNIRMDGFMDPDHTDLINLRYLIQACCASDEDRTIVDRREQGCTDMEISKVLGTDRQSVGKMRAAIYSRFQEVTHNS